MQNGPLDLKDLLNEFNSIPDNPINENNSNPKNKLNYPNHNFQLPSKEFKPLIEGFDVSKHLGSDIYQMRHPIEDNTTNYKNNKDDWKAVKGSIEQDKNTQEKPLPSSEKVPTPDIKPLPDNIEFDGEFSDPEKRAILSIFDTAWKPTFKKELVANKKELLTGYKNSDDSSVNSTVTVRDKDNKSYSIPYKLIDKLFSRSKEVNLNINNISTPYILLVPKNENEIVEVIRYTNDITLVKFNDKDKIHIIKLNIGTYNSIFSKTKDEFKPIPKPTLQMVDEEDEIKPVSKPIPKPTLQMVDEEDEVKSNKPKASFKSNISEEKLKKLREKNIKINPKNKINDKLIKPKLPEPQDIVGKDIIVNNDTTGNKDVKIRINSYDPKTNSFSVNWKNGNWKGIPHDFLQKSFKRLAAR